MDKKLSSPTNSTTKLEPKIKTEPPIQLVDLITIGNITIAKINNCNQTTLDKLGNFTKLNLESDTNVTKQQQQPDIIPINATTTNNSLKSSSAFSIFWIKYHMGCRSS